MTDEKIVAQILPPLLRNDLIWRGVNKDMDGIDEVHRNARRDYPELFQPIDDSPCLHPSKIKIQ
jgi:hypothetical protein